MRATGPAASSSLALLDCPHRANLQTGAGFGSQPSGTAVSENQGVESRSAIGASDFLEGEERDQRKHMMTAIAAMPGSVPPPRSGLLSARLLPRMRPTPTSSTT